MIAAKQFRWVSDGHVLQFEEGQEVTLPTVELEKAAAYGLAVEPRHDQAITHPEPEAEQEQEPAAEQTQETPQPAPEAVQTGRRRRQRQTKD